MPVPRGKTIFKQGDKVNLAARFREHVKIFVVNVDIAVKVRGGGILGQNVVVDEEF